MVRQPYKKLELKIDFREILWDLASQWKAVLLVALIMSVLVCCGKHVKDMQSYEAEIQAAKEAAEQALIPPEERIESIMQALPDSERDVVNLIVSEKEWIAKEKEYISESIIMKTNSSNQRVLKLVYNIESADNSELPLLMHMYSSYVYSDEVVESIKPIISPDSKSEYIGELFYNEEDESVDAEIGENTAVLGINMVLPEEVDARAVSDAITKAFFDFCNSIQSEHPHKVSCISEQVTHIYHKKNAERRMTIFNNINNLEAALKTSMASLTETQLAAVTAIMAIKAETNAETEVISESDTSAEAPGFSKKYAVLGFILGALFYGFLYVVWLIMKGRVNNAADVTEYTKSRLLGEVYFENESSGIRRLFRSGAVNRYRRRGQGTEEDQLNRVLSATEASCEHRGIDGVTAVRTFGDMKEIGKAEDAVAAIVNCGMISSLLDAGNVVDEKQLSNLKDVVLLVSESTDISVLNRIVSLCNEYEIKILGSVFIARA